MRYLSIALIALFGIVDQVECQIPLELVAEFDFQTHNRVFDIRHWQSDSTYGYAFAASNVIHYAYDLDGQEQSIVVPRSLFDGYFGSWSTTSHQIEGLQLLKLVDEDSNPRMAIFAAVKGIVDLTDDLFYVDLLLLYDAETAELIDSTSLISGGGANLPGGPSYRTTSSAASIRVWPPLPAVSRHLVFVHKSEFIYHGQSDHVRTTTDGTVYYGDLTSQPFHVQAIDSGYHADIIPDLSGMTCIIGGQRIDEVQHGDGSWEQTISRWIYSFNVDGIVDPLLDCAELDYCIAPNVQSLLIDSSRVLLFGNQAALRRADYSVVWRNTDLVDAWSRITLSPWGDASGQEYLFYYNQLNNIFEVFCGADGEFVGNSAAFEGGLYGPNSDFRYPIVLKDGHGNDEFVAVVFDEQHPTRTLRIYRPWLCQPDELVLHYDSETGQMELRWDAIDGAREYQIFHKRLDTDDGELIASVPGDRNFFSSELTDSFGFYEVKAHFRNIRTSPEFSPINSNLNAR